jgi:hypothetical protein
VKLLLCSFLFLIISAKASAVVGFQLGTGGLTPHFSGAKKNYCNQWNNTGIIVNKTYYLTLLMGDIGFTYIRGNDSICSEIEGIFLHFNLQEHQWWDIGIQVGGYAFNETNWEKHAAITPSGIEAPEPVTARINGRAFVPVLALSWNVHLIRRDVWSLKLNNMLTPVITNHSLAFEYRFN